MNKTAIIILVIAILIVLIAGVYFLLQRPGQPAGKNNNPAGAQNQENTSGNFEMIQGMKVEILKEGSGRQAKPGDKVAVDYSGTLESGVKFDSSIDRGTPFSFTLGANNVIRGWELGVLGMRAGEERRLTIPPELGYGSAGAGGVIPPNAILIFTIDMLKIGE